jgi:hypothetical protein
MCRLVVLLFGLAYVVALGLMVIGTFGLFGSEKDPLAGVFLVPLGWPWNLFVEAAPESSWPWLAATAPVLNLALIAFVCRHLRRRR